jgi:hypothetical protein
MSSNHAKGRKRKATNIAPESVSSSDDGQEEGSQSEHRERFGIDSRFSAGRYAGGDCENRRSEHRIYCQRRR